MKRLYLIYIGIVGCLCFSACSKNEDLFIDERMGNISLSAVVDELKIVTKTLNDNAYTGSVPSPDKNLEAAVWFSLESGCYPESLSDDETDETKIALSAETNLPIHGVINFQSGTATFPESNDGLEPKYPVNDQPVYCVGLYPHEGWTVDESATKATHAITGTEDLMFAPEISGSWNQHFEIQRYRHLLTWLKICVCTTTPEAGKYWGKLKNITLKEMSGSLTIDLTKPEGASFSLENTVSFTAGTLDMPILRDAAIDLNIKAQEVASVFCRPKSSYTLVVECENGKTSTIDIPLSVLDGGDVSLLNYPAGLQYVVILYFHPYNVVDGVCTLNAWNAENEDLYGNPGT